MNSLKILIVHNTYQHGGGEDVVFEYESNLLKSKNIEVENLLFDNKEIKGIISKMNTGFGSIYNIQSAAIVQRKINFFKPDIIHVHNFFPLISPSIFFVAHKNKIPIISSLHNFRLLCPSTYLLHNGIIYEKSISSQFPIDAILKGVYRNSMIQTTASILMSRVHNWINTWQNRVNRFVLNSEFEKQLFLRSVINIKESQFFIKPNFCPDYLGTEIIAREDFFLFVGRLSPEKGIDTLIDAAKFSGKKIFIIGDGPLYGFVDQESKQYNNIVLLGRKAKHEMISLIKRSKALIFPSIWYEGQPMTLLETLSTGTPIIASNLGAMSEIIDDNINGFLFEPGNGTALAEKLELFDLNNSIQEQLSQNARKTYEIKYTPEQNYNYLKELYESVL